MPNYSYLIWFDFDLLYHRIYSTISSLPVDNVSPAAKIVRKFEENYYNDDLTASMRKPKRDPLVLDSESEQNDEDSEI